MEEEEEEGTGASVLLVFASGVVLVVSALGVVLPSVCGRVVLDSGTAGGVETGVAVGSEVPFV